MSDTPRTDEAALREYHSNDSAPQVVYADFARTLERELAEARKERDNARQEVAKTAIECADYAGQVYILKAVKAERDALKRVVDEQTRQLEMTINQGREVAQERDRLAKADAKYHNGHSNFSGKAVPWAKTEQEDG